MIEEWVLEKLQPLTGESPIVLQDPQRMIQPGAYVIDGWAEENNYTVLFCVGNLALREMLELMDDEHRNQVFPKNLVSHEQRLLLVDRSREDARIPLFYPDVAVRAGSKRTLRLSLRQMLVERTGDTRWPHLVEERNLSRLILDHLPGVLESHAALRRINANRFSDTDLYKILLGAVLQINPFRKLSADDVRRLCIEQHGALGELKRILPEEVFATLRQRIERAPRPFCWLLDHDPNLVIRAFTLAALMHQHGLDYGLLLPNLDPALHAYREIDPAFLDQAMQEQIGADPDQVSADVHEAERFLCDDRGRLALLLRDQLGLDDPRRALAALERERLSPLVCSLALTSLLADLLSQRNVKFHKGVLALLDEQTASADRPALRRLGEAWRNLENAYRQALKTLDLSGQLGRYVKQMQVTPSEELTFDLFHRFWNEEGFNRLDYYTSDLERTLRVGNVLPIAQSNFWPELAGRWEQARVDLAETVKATSNVQHLMNHRFQDLYQRGYAGWIRRDDAPMVFTHQFLPRLLKAHWDPQSGQKAVVLVFDGLRTDAWDELLRPVLEERYALVESRPGSAILPTETHLSRKAISAGCLPEDFVSTNELTLLRGWLQEKMGLNLHFDVVRDDDTVASGMTVRYVSDRLEYIVFNFTDKNLHDNPQDLAFIYNTTVREIIRQDVRSVLRELPDDALVFVTSDHGFAPVPEASFTVLESAVVSHHDVKYRVARTNSLLTEADQKRAVALDVRTLGIPTTSEGNRALHFQHLLFPRPRYTLRRPRGPHKPDRYTHGGLSLAECMVPMVVMGPQPAAQPLLSIDGLRQVGSVSEGEELTLEITVAPLRIGHGDLAITLAFSREEIPTRRELLGDAPTTYQVRWMPHLGDVSEEDRRQGTLVQPVTLILTYRERGRPVRLSRSADVRIKLDPARLRRRVDSKLDLLMGKRPGGPA